MAREKHLLHGKSKKQNYATEFCSNEPTYNKRGAVGGVSHVLWTRLYKEHQ
jgi:hypothetical protein